MADSTISNLPANTAVDPVNDVLPIVNNGVTKKASPQGIVNSAFPQVPFTPTGGISSTTVNAAIAELDTEKANTSTVNAALALKADTTALPTAMDSATAQAGTSTTAQTVSASVLKAGVYGALNSIELLPSNSASINSAIIQSAIDLAETRASTNKSIEHIYFKGNGTILISTAILCGDRVICHFDDTLEIKASGTFGTLYKTKAIDATRTTINSITYTANSYTQVINITGHTFTTQDKIWISGTNTGSNNFPFYGIFDIKSVVAGTSITIVLKRPAIGAPTGTFTALKAFQYSGIIGGKWNYNFTGGNSPADTWLRHAIRLGGVYRGIVSNIVGKDTFKYLIELGAVKDPTVSKISSDGILESDAIKVYGPAFDINIDDVSTYSKDDCVTIQPKNPPAFINYEWCFGDIIGGNINNISGIANTARHAIYTCSTGGIVDNITYTNMGNNMTQGFYWHVECEDGGTGQLGTLFLNNPAGLLVLGGGIDYVTGISGSVSFYAININGFNASNTDPNYPINGFQTGNGGAITGTVNIQNASLEYVDKFINDNSPGNLVVNICNMRLLHSYGATFTCSKNSGSTTINLINSQIENTPANYGYLFTCAGTAPALNIYFSNVSMPTGCAIFKSGGGTIKSYGFDYITDAGLLTLVKNGRANHSSAVAGRNGAAQQGLAICNGTNWYALGTGAGGINTLIV